MIEAEKNNGCFMVKNLGLIDYNGVKKTRLLCRCKCGEERVLSVFDWNKGTGLCRKCINREYVGEISGVYFSYIKYNAIKRGIEFDISKQYIWDLFLKCNRKCK